jgi:hypothetical protein
MFTLNSISGTNQEIINSFGTFLESYGWSLHYSQTEPNGRPSKVYKKDGYEFYWKGEEVGLYPFVVNFMFGSEFYTTTMNKRVFNSIVGSGSISFYNYNDWFYWSTLANKSFSGLVPSEFTYSPSQRILAGTSLNVISSGRKFLIEGDYSNLKDLSVYPIPNLNSMYTGGSLSEKVRLHYNGESCFDLPFVKVFSNYRLRQLGQVVSVYSEDYTIDLISSLSYGIKFQ